MKKISTLVVFINLTGVVLGALGAHGLAEQLAAAGRTEVWGTAVLYQLVHGVALWALLARPELNRWHHHTVVLWVAGIAAFCGSLYLLSLGGPRWLGPITPLGGLCFMLGWLAAGRAEWLRHDSTA